MKFSNYLSEQASHTDIADVNEILYGLYMAKGNWSVYQDAAYIKKQLEMKSSKLSPEQYADEEGRAKVMVEATLDWMRKNGYPGNVVKVWWTARPGVLSAAVGQPVDSRKNPTDVLVQTSDGKFLGLSAKSTKGKGDIGFKNPGVGTVSKSLGIDLTVHEKNAEAAIMAKFPDLPKSKSARKPFVRQNPEIQAETEKAGKAVLAAIRDSLLNNLMNMGQDKLREYILTDWMDAEGLYPPYIKVTGHGKNGKYNATITDPLKNSKAKSLSQQLRVVPVGTDSIGIEAGGVKVMKMRVKYESEKLSSSVKFSGEPW